jgi:hypothetical protein
MRHTLADMAASEKTSIVALTCGVARLFGGLCDFVGDYVFSEWKMISAIAVVFAFVHATMIIDPVSPTL